jgi:hypothetical protein
MMSSEQKPIPNPDLPCTWQTTAVCQSCQAKGRLMCRLDLNDMASFFMLVLPFGVTAIGGMIRAGFAAIARFGQKMSEPCVAMPITG